MSSTLDAAVDPTIVPDLALVKDPAPDPHLVLVIDERTEAAIHLRAMAKGYREAAALCEARANVLSPPPPTDVTFDEVQIGDHVLLEQEWWKVIKREMVHDLDGRSCYLIAKPCEGPGQSIGHRHEVGENELIVRGAF